MGHVVAKEMAFELKGMTLELEGRLDPAKFSGQPTDSRAGFQDIKVKIKADSNATAEQLRVWLDTVEGRCPVGDNLSNPTSVKITVN